MSMDSSVLVAVDLGYGSTKAEVKDFSQGRHKSIVIPSGAARFVDMPFSGDNKRSLASGEVVMVDGEKWVGGIVQSDVRGSVRQTHAGYTSTSAYYAIFLAALARLDVKHVNELITGLPVAQFFGEENKEIRQNLKQRFIGKHTLGNGRTVQVDRVFVIAQPVGSYIDTIQRPEFEYLAERNSGRVLCVDVGFGTLDWVVIRNSDVDTRFSGSSRSSMKRVLSDLSDAIFEEHKRRIDVDSLDEMLRSNTSIVVHESSSIKRNWDSRLQDFASKIGENAVGEVMQSIGENDDISLVILTGGGAGLFEPAFKKHLPNLKDRIFVTGGKAGETSATANVRGYMAFLENLAHA